MEKKLAAEKPLQVVEAETASSAHDKPLCGPVEPVADRPNRVEAEEAVRTLIKWAGDDPDREGLLDTPGRVVRSYEEFYDGYEADLDTLKKRGCGSWSAAQSGSTHRHFLLGLPRMRFFLH